MRVRNSPAKQRYRSLVNIINHHTALIILLAIVTILTYSNSLGNSFLYDDDALVVNNPYVKNWHYLRVLFTTDLFHGTGRPSNFYRPMQSLSYLCDYTFWKLNPSGYHLTNIMLHAATVCLAYLLLDKIVKRRKVAFAAAFLFAIHPIHTEAVSYIAGRADPLAGCFLLAGLLFYLNASESVCAKKKIINQTASLVTFALALLARESMLVFPLLLVSCDLIFPHPLRQNKASGAERKRQWLRYLPYLLLLAVYASVRSAIIKFSPEPTLLSETPLYLRLCTTAKALWFYLRLLVFPFPLHMERSIMPVSTAFEPLVITSLLLTTAAWVVAIRKRKTFPLFLFTLCWFFIHLLPVSNIIPLNATMAEHWLYLPSLSFFLIVSLGVVNVLDYFVLKRLSFLRKGLQASFALFFVFYFILTIRQNSSYWKDDLTFYQQTLRYVPNNLRMRRNLGYAYYKRKEYDRAISTYKEALKIAPGEAGIRADLGTVYYQMAQYKQAIDEQLKALKIKPDFALAYWKLGHIYLKQERYQEAIDAYRKSLESDPHSDIAYYGLAFAYEKLGDNGQAIEIYQQVLQINPFHLNACSRLGNLLVNANQLEAGIKLLEKVLRLDPDNVLAHTSLGNAYQKREEYQKAKHQYQKALLLQPENIPALLALGVAYYTDQQYTQAEKTFRKVLQLDPEMVEALNNLGAVYLATGNVEQAIVQFEAALTTTPDNASLLNNLGYLYVETERDIDHGIELIQQALALQPENPNYRDSLGWAYYKKGMYQEALEQLQEAVRKGSKNIPTYEHLALVYEALKMNDEARGVWQEILKLDPDHARAKEKTASRHP